MKQLEMSSSSGRVVTTEQQAHGNKPQGKTPDDLADSHQMRLKLHEYKKDLFSAPPNSILIHACNTRGVWGSGIAAAFRQRYPAAFQIYRAHCLQMHHQRNAPVPTGTCLLIPPCETKTGAASHWIGCLFTSAKYGRAKDTPRTILKNTGSAVRALLHQVQVIRASGEVVGQLVMCRINSGRFGVDWDRTVDVLRNVDVQEGTVSEVEVWSMDED
ncbi:hypothetical protein M011DRAFT_465108 [Sporormia fimetaria CBS 119925]|uniref:ADP-ribose 1''-phosphate phosphatase n=1 Tax=Sporormia fimetaria CBS 119925 TaxID=1340428 RepID=A0A6A6VM96_9PLEO|nr:hypothetical protein M011DRAFT_465108 [Sporormia fimetaria CBS 119925]